MNIQIENIILYDYYKPLLTEKQKQYFEDYYFQDLSLSEIAENNNVSKAAVHNNLKNTIKLITTYEEKLNLNKNAKIIKELINKEEYKRIKEYI